MTTKSIMKSDLITVKADTKVSEAIALLIEHGISGLPVVDSEHRIVGILSEKDLLRVFYEGDTAKPVVEAFMTRDPVTFAVDAPLVDVLDCLMANNFRRVLIHEDGKLVGLVSRADMMPPILAALLDRS